MNTLTNTPTVPRTADQIVNIEFADDTRPHDDLKKLFKYDNDETPLGKETLLADYLTPSNTGKFIIYQNSKTRDSNESFNTGGRNTNYNFLQINSNRGFSRSMNPTAVVSITRLFGQYNIIGGRSRQRKTLARKNRKSRSRKNRKSRSRKNRK
jgi:hypothetical protein